MKNNKNKSVESKPVNVFRVPFTKAEIESADVETTGSIKEVTNMMRQHFGYAAISGRITNKSIVLSRYGLPRDATQKQIMEAIAKQK